jgi:NAD(P)H-hydrate repair Nnr-like enzyme with NAD(P)H-hydrate dehydratase domain
VLRSTPKEVQSNRIEAVRKISQRFGDTWVILKGHQTIIGRSSGALYVNCSGNPYLAQGGSGDLLSGFIAGLVVQPELQTDIHTTIRYAVWQHGATADALQERRSNWVVEDLAEELGNCHIPA